MHLVDLPEAFIVGICEYIPRGENTYAQLRSIHALIQTCMKFSFLRKYNYFILTQSNTFLDGPWYQAYSVNTSGVRNGPEYNWLCKEEKITLFGYRYYIAGVLNYELVMNDVWDTFGITLNSVTYTVTEQVLVNTLKKLKDLYESVYDLDVVQICLHFTLNTMKKTWLIRKVFPWFRITPTDFNLT